MSKLKKVLLMCTAYVLVAALAIGGTVAYLTSEDSDVNVMTLGNVSIEQIEQQKNAAGELEPFEQAKDLYPGTEISKIVTVENTGKTDAYFRTLIAFEDLPESETFGINFGFTDTAYTIMPWGGEPVAIEIDGTDYVVYEFIHKTVLTAGATSQPSLYEVNMATTSTNEDMKLLGDTYDILVLSQAVQAAGFANATTALDTAFGDVNATNCAEWFGGVLADNDAIDTEAEFVAALENGGDIKLGADIALTGESTVLTKNATIDLNGHKLSATRPYNAGDDLANAVLTVSGAELTLTGNGEVNNDGYCAILLVDGAKVTIENGTYIADTSAVYVKYGELFIKDGFYQAREETSPVPDYTATYQGVEYTMYLAGVINCSKGSYINYKAGDRDEAWANVDISGGTFVNEDPSDLAEGWNLEESHVIEGYKVERTEQSNGDAWYTVVPNK